MALYQATVTTAPVDISALLGVARGVSKECRGINLGQRPVYRAVASTPPSDLDGPVWRYSPGEAFNLILYAGSDGNTYLLTSDGESTVTLEDALPWS